jgi:hypothetical protein
MFGVQPVSGFGKLDKDDSADEGVDEGGEKTLAEEQIYGTEEGCFERRLSQCSRSFIFPLAPRQRWRPLPDASSHSPSLTL